MTKDTRRNYLLLTLILCLLFLDVPFLSAQAPYLIKDINASGDSSPEWLTDVNGTLFFVANDGVHGAELWMSDGTAEGTLMVKDINTQGGSSPTSLVNVDGTLYFAARNSTNDLELWKSDGTEAGTVQISDFQSGALASTVNSLVAFNGVSFFQGPGGGGPSIHGFWRSDGTREGTFMLKDISVQSLTPVNDLLFLDGYDGNTWALWKSDGTSEGTVLIKDTNPNNVHNFVEEPAALNGELLFVAEDNSGDKELWKSDGSPDGTVRVKDINPQGTSDPSELINVDGSLFFRANDGTYGIELWRSDGTAEGTVMVKDINSNGSSSPTALIGLGGIVYFSASDGTTDGLWRSDGTSDGTYLVKDIDPENFRSYISYLSDPNVVNDLVCFSARDEHGFELWCSDGTADGTFMAGDINPQGDSNPTELTTVGGTLFFSADDGENGAELYALKPTATAVASHPSSPVGYRLAQNYPNPSNPSTTIEFAHPRRTAVDLKVYDITGREVALLVDDVLGAGPHEVAFDAGGLPSGVYLYRIQARDFVQAKKLTIVK